MCNVQMYKVKGDKHIKQWMMNETEEIIEIGRDEKERKRAFSFTLSLSSDLFDSVNSLNFLHHKPILSI